MAVVSLVFVLLYFYLIFKKDLVSKVKDMDYSTLPTPESAITDKRGFIISTIIFLVTVVLLVTHAQTGLTVSAIGVFVAIVTLVFSWKNAIILLKKVDYKTIGFFIGLFVVIGGLEQTGVLEIVAGYIGKISGGNAMVMIAIIIWLSAIASAIVDNIPFATTMIPIIKTLSATFGIDLEILSWTLAMGTDIGGSATPIGASANVVGIATAAREGYVIKWGPYLKKMVPATIVVVFISMVIIYVRYL
jgi:Na+/H+ antiporter NhaD/arsenite permease-like protein